VATRIVSEATRCGCDAALPNHLVLSPNVIKSGPAHVMCSSAVP